MSRGVFEGVTPPRSACNAYDLVITDKSNRVRRTRDPYSFLPTLGESDSSFLERRRTPDLRETWRAIADHRRCARDELAVWAPNAQRVSVVGDFNHWDGRCHAMRSLGASGVWGNIRSGRRRGAHYKFEVRNLQGNIGLKTDPYGFFSKLRKNAASSGRPGSSNGRMQPGWSRGVSAIRCVPQLSIYEMHPASGERRPRANPSATASWRSR